MKNEKSPIAFRIQTLRVKKGLNQEQLAQKVGVTIDTIKNWESSRRTPSPENLKHLCLILHSTEEFIRNGDNSHQKLLQKWNATLNPEKIHQEVKLLEYCEEVLCCDFSEFDEKSWDEFENQCKKSIINIYEKIRKEV